MFCAKCGTKLGDGAAFCRICGERQIQLTQKPQQNTEVEKTMGVFNTETPVPASPVQINQEAPLQNVSGSVEKTMGVFSQNAVTQTAQNQGGEIIYIKPGTILHGRYTVGEVLGNGGFGITYFGQDNSLQMKVAIKEFFPRALVTRNNTISENVECINSQELFENEKSKVIKEARILAKFAKTPGIVNVLEYFEENNTAYIVMEYIEGGTLKEAIKRNGLMTPDYAFSALTPIMQVVGQLHRENVIHRDISPDNIMFDSNQPKLLDFGAAREILGETGDGLSIILKHGYAPQEQYSRKGNQGTWTDVYSLCATIYYCITGKTPDSALDRIHNDELIRPSQLGVKITPAQENALMQGLSIFPANRLQSIDQFVAAWNAGGTVYANNVQANIVNAKAHINSNQPKSKKKKTGLVFGIIAGAVVLLVLIIVIASSIGGNTTSNMNTSTSTKPNTTSGTSSPAVTEKDDAKLQEYIDQANELADKGNYDEAFAKLDTAEQLYGKSTLISDKRTEIMKLRALKEINGFKQKNDYQGAIQYIRKLSNEIINDSDIVEQKNLCTSKYREQVLSDAESAFNSDGYAAAIDVLNSALSTLPNDSTLTSKIEDYNEYAPVSLKKIKATSGKSYHFPSTAKDPRDNNYIDALYLDSSRSNMETFTGSAEFYLGKLYSKFKCKIVPEKDFSTGNKAECYIRIYLDDVLVYTSEKITYKTTGIDVNINVSNAEYLRISLYNPTASEWYMEQAPTLLVDPQVSK